MAGLFTIDVQKLKTWADIVQFPVLILGYIAFVSPGFPFLKVQGRVMWSIYCQVKHWIRVVPIKPKVRLILEGCTYEGWIILRSLIFSACSVVCLFKPHTQDSIEMFEKAVKLAQCHPQPIFWIFTETSNRCLGQWKSSTCLINLRLNLVGSLCWTLSFPVGWMTSKFQIYAHL